MANVTILSLAFPPDAVSTGQLMADVASDLGTAGHSVVVITTTSHYNPDSAQLTRQRLRSVPGGLFYRSDYGPVRVLHIAIGRKSPRLLQRIWGWLHFHCAALLLLIAETPRPDVIIVPSPLLSLGLVGRLATLARGGRLIYSVFELYPDLAINAGLIRNKAVIAVLRWLERRVYGGAFAVTATSRGIHRRLGERTAPAKVVYVPNFADLRQFDHSAPGNKFAKEHGLMDCFTVTYAGNIGPMQGLGVVLAAAEQLLHDHTVRFVFVGGGTAADSLRSEASRRSLTNVVFVPHQPYERVPEIYSASHVLIAALVGPIGGDAVPSKVYGIMASSRPVLAITEDWSELASVIKEAGAGVVVPPRDAAALAAAVVRLKEDEGLRHECGAAGRSYVATHCSRDRVSATYGALVEAALESRLTPAEAVRKFSGNTVTSAAARS